MPSARTMPLRGPRASMNRVRGTDGLRTADKTAVSLPGSHEPDLLVAEDLTVLIQFPSGSVPVVDAVGLRIGFGEVVGLVGESGCGKSMTALAVLGLTPDVARVEGHIYLNGRELVGVSDRDMRTIRG